MNCLGLRLIGTVLGAISDKTMDVLKCMCRKCQKRNINEKNENEKKIYIYI